MSVYKVSNYKEWVDATKSIVIEMEEVKDLYPEEVLDTGSFIIEQCIIGKELAIDACYSTSGEPVILGIFDIWV